MADRAVASGRGAPRGRAASLLLAASLTLPFPAAGLAARRICDGMALIAANGLWSGAEILSPRGAADLSATTGPLIGVGDPAMIALPWGVDTGAEADAIASPVGDKGKKKLPAARPRRGILVRAAVIARAVESGTRPTGVAVPASGQRPAGLALQGVSGFGAGLADGDVLTSVGGTAAMSVGAVVGAVAGAVRSRARALGAVVWRGDHSIVVTVELPRIEPSAR